MRYGDAVNVTTSRGNVSGRLWSNIFLARGFFTQNLANGLTLVFKAGAVCTKVCPYGSVRGAGSNPCPYRDYTRIKCVGFTETIYTSLAPGVSKMSRRADVSNLIRWHCAADHLPSEGAGGNTPVSKEARIRLGRGLFRLQMGEQIGMPHSRPMPGVAAGVSELRAKGEYGSFRAFYYTASS